MTLSTIVTGLCTLPAVAYLSENPNAIAIGPKITSLFETPSRQQLRDAQETIEASDNSLNALKQEEIKENGPLKTPPAAPTGVALPRIIASVYDFATGQIGMYQLPEESGGEMTLVAANVSSYYGGALDPRGESNIYYACHDGRYQDYWDTDGDRHGHKIQGYNTETWEPVGSEINLPAYRSSDMAIHPETGLAYAFCDYGSMMYNLYSIDLSTGTQTRLAPSGTMMPEESARALAFAPDGTLYGVTKNGKFGIVSLVDGKTTVISSLGIDGDLRHQWTGAIDPDTGNFIFIYNVNDGGYSGTGADEKARLYSINPTTGEATLLADFAGKEITAMYIVPDMTDAQAPAAPGELTANFANGSLSGSFSFTMPSTLYDGSAASGNASWTIADGKNTLTTGSASYGSEVVANVTFTEPGEHKISYWASNAAGDGKKGRANIWVGPDVPKAPANVTVLLDEANNTFSISWEAVTEGEHDGYVDASAIRYDLVRMPGAVTVAEDIEDTSYTDIYTPNGIENVTYKVLARQGDLVSAPGISVPVTTGALALPYDMSAGDYYSRLENWTIIDANNDGSTWENYNPTLRYKYNSNNPGDDWAITPPINAFAGCHYKVNVSFHGYSASYPEMVEVKMGYAPTAEAMTETLLEPTEIRCGSSDPVSFELDAAPTRNGKMFIGIHAISTKDQFYLYLSDLKIAAPIAEGSPAVCENLTIVADPSGALSVSGHGTAPSVNTEGGMLPSLTKVEIRRNNTLVTTIDNVTPGGGFDFIDSVEEGGLYTYTATAYNGEDAGDPGDGVTIYVGINTPGEATNIQIEETSVPGQIRVTWDAPVVDWLGNNLNGPLTYDVEIFPDNAYYHGNYTEEGVTGNECLLTPTFADGRDHGFVYVKVAPVNAKGKGYAGKSRNIAIGNPLPCPFKESFPNYTLEHPWGDGESNGPQVGSISDDERSLSWSQYNGWNRMMDRSFPNSDGAQDGDNGFAGMFGWSYAADAQGGRHNEYTELLSPKIDLTGLSSPMLTFYTFNWLSVTNGQDFNEIDVDVVCEGVRENVKHLVIKDLGDAQRWEMVAVDLSAYTGKVITLVITGRIVAIGDQGYNWVLLDNIRIADINPVDLEISLIQAPIKAAPGEEFDIKAYVTNKGSQNVPSFRADLMHNDELIASQEYENLGFNKGIDISFTTSLTPLDPIGNNYSIVIDAAGDANESDNVSETVTVARYLKLLPEPRNVFFNSGNEGNFAWETPDLATAAPAPTYETFESYRSFETYEVFPTEVGDWVFVDVDQRPIGGMFNNSTMAIMEFPGIPTHSAQSWWLQCRYFEEFNDTYYGHSGLYYLANMYVVNDAYNQGEQQDDWAISPELCGKEQLISLWARSYNRDTPETIEFYWSEDSTAPEDFTFIRRIENLSAEWTEYIFVVPDGARRFAIRGCSNAPFGTAQTFIDDVTYVGGGDEPQTLTLLGYNVYRNNELYRNYTSDTLSHEIEAGEGTSSYAVSAVYEEGESKAVKVGEGSGISGLAQTLRISAVGETIRISGLAGQSYVVYDLGGRTIASGSGKDNVEISATKGVYTVKAANCLRKIVVK